MSQPVEKHAQNLTITARICGSTAYETFWLRYNCIVVLVSIMRSGTHQQ